MKITEYTTVGKSNTTRKKESTSSVGGGGFLGLLSASEVDSASQAAPTQDIVPSNSMNALLSLQEMPDDEVNRRRAMQESNGTLEALEMLRVSLLTGNIPEHLLHTLTSVVAVQKKQVNDPRLMNLIEDIELRAAVELAKLERATQKNT